MKIKLATAFLMLYEVIFPTNTQFSHQCISSQYISDCHPIIQIILVGFPFMRRDQLSINITFCHFENMLTENHFQSHWKFPDLWNAGNIFSTVAFSSVSTIWMTLIQSRIVTKRIHVTSSQKNMYSITQFNSMLMRYFIFVQGFVSVR